MEVKKDYRDFLACLNARSVEYIVVGGYAVAFHGFVRFTGDFDVFVRPTLENGGRVMAAMRDFGNLPPTLNLTDFEDTRTIIQMGREPVRIDVITGIEGVTWEEAFASRIAAHYGDIDAHFIGIDALLKNKKTVGRLKDLMDLEGLGRKPSPNKLRNVKRKKS